MGSQMLPETSAASLSLVTIAARTLLTLSSIRNRSGGLAGACTSSFFFAGSTWLYHCDQRRAADHLQKFFLQEDGSLTGFFGDLADTKTHFPIARRAARAAGY